MLATGTLLKFIFKLFTQWRNSNKSCLDEERKNCLDCLSFINIETDSVSSNECYSKLCNTSQTIASAIFVKDKERRLKVTHNVIKNLTIRNFWYDKGLSLSPKY
jgi:hypothetical protein